MTRSRLLTLALGVTLAAGTSAHHSRNNFDMETLLELRGVITEFTWRNPHAFATIAVEGETGETEELLMELNSIAVLTRRGWTPDTMEVGDEVTVFANPDKDRGKNLFYSNYWVLPDGSTIASAGEAPATDRTPQVQRQVDSSARSEDLSGIWRIENFGPGARGMGMGASSPPEGAPATPSFGGQGPATGFPLTASAQAELDGWDVRDNPWFRCVSRTPPWLYYGVDATRIVLESESRILIEHEINEVERIIHLGLTEHPEGTETSHLGHSIGWYEGDTLVIDTRYFAPAEWGIGNGISSSAEKRLTERLTLIDDGRRMQLEFTLWDPAALTEPLTLSRTFALDPGYPWQEEYDCDPEASSRHLVD